jgi:hypothetical protein
MSNPVATPPGENETLAISVNRLTESGYTDWFKAEPGGLRAAEAGCLHAPEAMRVDELVRFEGATNPDDEAVVFALECKEHGIQGTYTVPYGAGVPSADAEMVRRLQVATAKRG